MKTKKKIDKAAIEAKKRALEEKIEKSIEAAKLGKRRSPTSEFLDEIKDVIKKALDNGVSYRQLAKDIHDVYNFKVSEQTIRAFAHSVLGIPKKSRNAAPKPQQKPEQKNPALADENELV